MIYAVVNKDLYHYGIKGMKWGVRKEYVPKGRKSKKEKGIVDILLDPVLGPYTMYASVAAAVLAIHGAKRVSDLHKQGWFTEKYKASDIKKSNTTKAQDLKVLNPINPPVSDSVLFDLSHGKEVTDLSMKDQETIKTAHKNGWFDNCVYCTSAAALRRQGYDVEAKNSPGRGHTVEQTMKWWKGSKFENFYGESTSDPKKSEDFYNHSLRRAMNSTMSRDDQIAHIEKTLKSQGEGSYGDLRVRSAFFGHSIEYAVEKNNVVIYDNQFKQKYNSVDDFFSNHGGPFGFSPQNTTYIRLDNCTPDLDAMLKDHAIKPRGK